MKVPNDCIAYRVRLTIPQPTEWQHIGNEIDAALIFARSDFVNVHKGSVEPLAALA